jgi:uncharacterized SAM-binding protein YcdF (DUF218 family)
MIVLKTIHNLLMPSAFVFLFAILGFLLLLKKKKKWGRAFLFSSIFFYYIFSITPVTDFLLMSLEEKYKVLPVEEMPRAENVVLLLGGRESDVLRGSEVLRIWHLSEGRMKIIISGTDPVIATSEDAQAVRSFFINRGVDPDDIIIEGKSRNTRENVANVQEIVGEKPFFLVTSAFHMERSIVEFERVGGNPIPAPTDFKRRRIPVYRAFDFLPNSQNLRNSDLAFHEHLGAIYYRLIYLFGDKK